MANAAASSKARASRSAAAREHTKNDHRSKTTAGRRETEQAPSKASRIIKGILLFLGSLFGPAYAACVIYFAYLSVHFDMIVRQTQEVTILVTAVSVFALVMMLITRRQFLTKVTSLVLLPAMILPILLYFGQWNVLVPPFVCALLIFFFSGLGETAKTIWGTIILLLYLIGALVYFVTTSMFAPSTVTTTVETGESPSGIYRYSVMETVDSSNGSTKVVVETNALDRDYDLVLFRIKGLSRDVKLERPLNDDVTIEWETQSRQDITKELRRISNDIEVTLTDKQMDLLGRDAYAVTYADGHTETYSQADYHALRIPLTDEDREVLKIDDEEMRIDDMGPRSLTQKGMTVENFRTVRLFSLTDEELAQLGIPAEGDVMFYNGECVFRYYIAILEQYFDVSNQEIGLFS